jgi:hypothetical protein
MPAVLAPGRPFILGVNGQTLSFCGVGICDPMLQNSINALMPLVYDTAFHTWTLAAAGADLVHQPQELQLFTAGVGETGAATNVWYPKTPSETNLFRGGAPVDRPFMFLVTGLTFSALDPHQRGGEGAAAADPKYYSAWLQESEDGPGYSFLMQKFHINNDALRMRFGDTGCEYRVGLGAFSPPWGDPAGAQTVRNGLTSTPGMYLPFTTSVCIGSRDDVKQLTLFAATGHAGQIQNNAAVPTALPPENDDGTVYVPIRVATVGYMICVPLQDYCGVPSADEIARIRAQFGMTNVPG